MASRKARKTAKRRTYKRKAAPPRRRAIRKARSRAPVRKATRRKPRRNPSLMGNPTVRTLGFATLGFVSGKFADGFRVQAARKAEADRNLLDKIVGWLSWGYTQPVGLTVGLLFAALGLGIGKMGNAKTRRDLLAVGGGMLIEPVGGKVMSLLTPTETNVSSLRSGARVYKLSAPPMKNSSAIVAASRAVANNYAS
jgi:hypothetical protein